MARFRRLSDLNDPLPFVDPRWQYLLPEAPTAVTATAGNAQATVSWTAPESVADITDYYVQFQPSGGGWSTFSDGVSSGTSATVTGLTNGTAYQFRVAAVSGIGQGPWSTASSAVTPQAGDPLFASVSLLLHMDGSGSTFVDSSPTPKTITAFGNATQSTTQSKWGGKSAYFSGSGDWLSFADLELGTGDFTIEMFFKTNSSVQYAQLIGNEVSGGSAGFSLLINNDSSTGGQIALYRGSLIVQSASGDWSDDAWHHIAVVRSGSTVTLYIDGTSYGSGTTSASFNGGNYYVAYNNEFGPRNLVGYIDDLRITKAARYTGSSITVPAAAFPSP